VQNEIGKIEKIIAKPFSVKKGAALMYFPEANSLISQVVDPLSRTPGFKSTIISINKSNRYNIQGTVN